MRHLLMILTAILLTAGGGYALCAAVGWQARPASMAAAGAIALGAGALALVPLLLTRGAGQLARAQAALVSTLIHMMGCLGGAAVMLIAIKGPMAAAYWLLGFYWTTLAALVAGLTRELRGAPAGGALQKN